MFELICLIIIILIMVGIKWRQKQMLDTISNINKLLEKLCNKTEDGHDTLES